jgi:spermidine synthase
VTGFLLLGLFGETSSLLIAGFLNLIAAMLTIGLHLQLKNANQAVQKPQKLKGKTELPVTYGSRIRYWSRFAIFVSGFTALAYEILWTRLLLLPLRTSIYAFSFMLGLFLIGIAYGSWLSARSAISRERPVATFAVIEILIGFLTVAGMVAFSIFGKMSDGFISHLPLGIITAIVMVLPVAVAFGWQFPVAVRCCISDADYPGKATGWAYAANTLGAILGSIAAGFILIPFIGTTRAMVLLALLNIILGGILLWIRPREERGKHPLFAYAFITGIIALVSMVATPYKSVMHKRVQRFLGANAEMYAFYEGITGTVVPAGSPDNPLARHLFTNGEGMTALVSETKLMAHLPMALAKDPRDILVICFGMGTTLRSASRHPGAQVDIDAVDIVPSVFDSFGFFHRDADRVMKLPNVNLYADDGRNFLLVSQKLYDVITIDPAPPVCSAGTVNLYTREFLVLCKSRITVSGVVCLWLPPAPQSELLMIMKTFANVFPGASLWGGLKMPGFYLIGGNRSFGQTTESISSLARRLSKISDLGEWEPLYRNENMLKQIYLLGPKGLSAMVKNIPEVTDNHPYTEFPLWRGVFTGKIPELNSIAMRQLLKKMRQGHRS